MDYLRQGSLLNLITAGILWGITNPLIKKGSMGLSKIKKDNLIDQLIFEITFLLTNWKYILPFVINQFGSVLFFFNIQSADMSVAVPVANSVAFLFTGFCGWLLREKTPDIGSVCGLMFIAAGIGCFIIDVKN